MESSRFTSRNFKKCVVCSRRRTPGSNVFLARIPLDPDRARKWIQSIGQEDLVYIPIEKLHKLKSVCNVHFRQEDWNKSRTRLLSHAVPYLNLPLQPLNEELLHDFPLHIGQYQGHDSSEVPGSSCYNINVQSCNRQCVDKKGKASLDHSYCDIRTGTNINRTGTNINHVKEEDEISESLQEILEEDPLAFEEFEDDKDVKDDQDFKVDQDFKDDQDFSKKFEKLALDEIVTIPPDIVAWPEPSKNEAEVNKPEDPFLPKDPFLPDSLDPEVIKDGVQPDDHPTYGDKIHRKLCVLWPLILIHGLTTEARNTILNGYLVPKNCRLFQAPKMNAKIVEMVPEKAMANDSKWATMQQYIGTALTAINRAMESLLSSEADGKVLALRHLSNACLLLCDLHSSHTKIRVKNVTPYLDDTTQEVIKGLERDETVFGDNFIKKWITSKKREKPAKKVRPPKKEKEKKVASSGRSLVLYSGRWHPPLRKTGKVRRKKVSAGLRRQNVSATDSPLPISRKRRVRQSQVRAPVPPGQHILTSTESESAQYNPDENLRSFLLKRPSSPKTYSTKKCKQETKIDALAPDKETSHIHNMLMEESDSFVQEQIMEEQLNQSSITYTPNSTVMVTTGAVPLVLPQQLPARDMPTLLTYDENVPPDPSTYIEIVDDQTP